MNPTIREEQMSDLFTKFHINGLPFNAVIHKFSAPDDGDPHDHPFDFTSFIIKGSYVEQIYEISYKSSVNYSKHLETRRQGKSHHVSAKTIHRIIDLPDGECWTLILPEQWKREPCFWKFYSHEIKVRLWRQENFVPFINTEL